MTLKLQLDDVSAIQAAALRKKASRLGITPETYIKQLIEYDLELDEEAASRSLTEISSPFRDALIRMTERQLDTISRRRKLRSRSAKRP
jgi:hypothetical protein